MYFPIFNIKGKLLAFDNSSYTMEIKINNCPKKGYFESLEDENLNLYSWYINNI